VKVCQKEKFQKIKIKWKSSDFGSFESSKISRGKKRSVKICQISLVGFQSVAKNI
jgi:hypothetical protein